jgi:hypothetical protein
MTLRDLIVSIIGGLIVAILVGHFRGENAALLCLVVAALSLVAVELFFYTKGLIIHYAGHGIGAEQYADVTDILRGQVRNNRLNIVIDGAMFPRDPYPGEKKHVWVQYSYRSRAIKEKTKPDGDRLMLP